MNTDVKQNCKACKGLNLFLVKILFMKIRVYPWQKLFGSGLP